MRRDANSGVIDGEVEGSRVRFQHLNGDEVNQTTVGGVDREMVHKHTRLLLFENVKLICFDLHLRVECEGV